MRVAFVVLILMFAGSCDKRRPFTEPSNLQLRIQRPDATRSALKNAAIAEHAVIFVHLGWSPNSRLSGNFFDRFVQSYLLSERKPYVHFYCIDFTEGSYTKPEYEPLSTWDGWKDLEKKKGGSLLGGGGEFVWVHRGRVLHVQMPDEFNSVREAIVRTQKIFDDASRAK